jgi:energy-coupling factor transport system permease protein
VTAVAAPSAHAAAPQYDEFDPPTRGIGLVGKLAVFLAVTVVAATATDPVLLWPLLVGMLVLAFSTGLAPRTVLAAVKPLAPVMVLLFAFSALFYDPSTARQDYAHTVYAVLLQSDVIDLTVSLGGILFGLGIVGKLVLIMVASIYLISTTPMEQLLAGLQAIRVPNAIGLMMSTAIRFIPTMNSEVATIKDAQRARGAGSAKQQKGRGQAVQGILPLFVPMIVTSMRRADTMAMSMVSRGYGFTKQRTMLARLHVGAWDYVAAVLVIALVATFFLGRALLGLGIL